MQLIQTKNKFYDLKIQEKNELQPPGRIFPPGTD
jgi:hypothetical protein